MSALRNFLQTNHQQLVEAARRCCHAECYVVSFESRTFNGGESPDVIGWDGQGRSWLYECKASIEDFKQDQNKPFRSVEQLGMGDKRYYFTYPNLLNSDGLPNGWGLYELHGKKVIKIKESKIFKANKVKELEFLVSLCRRLGHFAPDQYGIKIDNTLIEGKPNGITVSK